MEIWKDIFGYEGLYQVSNYGRVKTFNYLGHAGKIKILKELIDKDGYTRSFLYKNGKSKTFKNHRLVICTFNEISLDTKLTVNHKDGNKQNNNLENLELCSIQENNKHALKTGLRVNAKGSKVGTSKLTEDKVKEIKKHLKHGIKVKDLSKLYGVKEITIYRIKNNESWKHVK